MVSLHTGGSAALTLQRWRVRVQIHWVEGHLAGTRDTLSSCHEGSFSLHQRSLEHTRHDPAPTLLCMSRKRPPDMELTWREEVDTWIVATLAALALTLLAVILALLSGESPIDTLKTMAGRTFSTTITRLLK